MAHSVEALDPVAPPLAILAALRDELGPIERQLAGRRVVRAEGGRYVAGLLAGRRVALLRTGVGPRAARRAADWMIRRTSPRALLAVGFAGGLKDGLELGDIVLGEEVYEPPPPEGEGPRDWAGDPQLLQAARSAVPGGPRIEVGRIATSRSVLHTSVLKRSFGERHRALAVDMESSGIARAANVHDSRVLYVRAIIDEVSYDAPIDLSGFFSAEGEARPFRALASLLRRPAAGIRGLAELRRRSQYAARSLAGYLPALLGSLPA